MEKVGRLFVGIDLPAEARSALAVGLMEWNEGRPLPGKPVQPQNWHLTLRFLGSIDQVTYERVLSHLDQSDLGRRFDVRLTDIGTFPNPRKATVLWIGIDRGLADLSRLADEADQAAQDADLRAEDRPFAPHLTLSRLRPPQDLRPLLDRPPIPPVVFAVDGVTIFRSHLERGGPRYEALEVFALT